MNHAHDRHEHTPPTHQSALTTVRYSLPELLYEIKLERVTGGFGMEKLQQSEIGKLFQSQAKRRRPTPRS